LFDPPCPTSLSKNIPFGICEYFGLKVASIFFAILSLSTLALVIFLIRTLDLYVATAFAFAGVLYVFYLAGKASNDFDRERERDSSKLRSNLPGIIFIVAIAPLASSLALAHYGFLGSPVQALFRSFIIVGFSITFFFISFSIPLALKQKIRESKLVFDPNYKPLVTVIVPAYNEAEVISRTLESLINVKYEPKEILVVDDGSTDKTAVIASWYKQFGVKVLRKPNGGKASALNYGLLFARGEIVVTVDADSMITRSALDEIVRAMSKRNIAAVSGYIRVLNNNVKLTRAQELEYIVGIEMLRRALDLFGAVMVVPGAFGAFKKYAIENTGYYDKDTITEDFDMTIKILKAYGSVGASSTAAAFTEVPSTWKSLYKQRMRWSRGTLQTAIKHRDAFWNARFGYLHTIVMPILFLSYLMPFASYAALMGGILLSLSGQYYIFAEMMILFFLIEFFVVMLTLSLNDSDYTLAWYAPAFVIGYKQFLDAMNIISVFGIIFSKDKKWHKTERVGGLPPIKVKQRI
jgi:cellulose synthase/poly-beta-1,6-N-acetylglucosamine synthase-like glycosyltransferase